MILGGTDGHWSEEVRLHICETAVYHLRQAIKKSNKKKHDNGGKEIAYEQHIDDSQFSYKERFTYSERQCQFLSTIHH